MDEARIADALERIADSLETLVEESQSPFEDVIVFEPEQLPPDSEPIFRIADFSRNKQAPMYAIEADVNGKKTKVNWESKVMVLTGTIVEVMSTDPLSPQFVILKGELDAYRSGDPENREVRGFLPPNIGWYCRLENGDAGFIMNDSDTNLLVA